MKPPRSGKIKTVAILGGGPAASDPTGFAWEDDNSQHVLYTGADHVIHELWQKK